MNKKALILTLALAVPASLAFAQRPAGPPPGGGPAGPPPDQQGGHHPHGNRPPKDGEKPDKPPFPPMPLQHVLDGDHDGIISAEEIKAAPDVLKQLDKNQDGKLTPEEYAPRRPGGPPPGGPNGDQKPPPPKDGAPQPGGPRDGDAKTPGPRDGDRRDDGPRSGEGKHRPPPPPLVSALDTDHDGVISAEEIAASANSLLALDKNHDGQLGPMEFMGRPPGDRPDGDGPKPPRPPKDQ